MIEKDMDRLLDALYVAETEATAEELSDLKAEARLMMSGINRFYGDVEKQTRYFIALLTCYELEVPPEIAVLTSVEYAEHPQSETNRALH